MTVKPPAPPITSPSPLKDPEPNTSRPQLPTEPEKEVGGQYGFCPHCGKAGGSRERRLNGNDTCANGHVYPSKDAVTHGPKVTQIDIPEVLVVKDEPKQHTARAIWPEPCIGDSFLFFQASTMDDRNVGRGCTIVEVNDDGTYDVDVRWFRRDTQAGKLQIERIYDVRWFNGDTLEGGPDGFWRWPHGKRFICRVTPATTEYVRPVRPGPTTTSSAPTQARPPEAPLERARPGQRASSSPAAAAPAKAATGAGSKPRETEIVPPPRPRTPVRNTGLVQPRAGVELEGATPGEIED